jgi:transcriptional regulator of acetoin/glycerol metabolism
MESFEQQPSEARDEGLLILSGPQIARAAVPQLPEPQAVVPLTELESQAIANALLHTGGDTALTARLLGIGRTTLYRKVKQYQLRAHLFYSRHAALSG